MSSDEGLSLFHSSNSMLSVRIQLNAAQKCVQRLPYFATGLFESNCVSECARSRLWRLETNILHELKAVNGDNRTAI